MKKNHIITYVIILILIIYGLIKSYFFGIQDGLLCGGFFSCDYISGFEGVKIFLTNVLLPIFEFGSIFGIIPILFFPVITIIVFKINLHNLINTPKKAKNILIICMIIHIAIPIILIVTTINRIYKTVELTNFLLIILPYIETMLIACEKLNETN